VGVRVVTLGSPFSSLYHRCVAAQPLHVVALSLPLDRELFHLPTARHSLPPKIKVHCMLSHPLRPAVVALGTSVGVFVLSVGSTFDMSATTIPVPVPFADASSSGVEVLGCHLSSDGGLMHFGASAFESPEALSAAACAAARVPLPVCDASVDLLLPLVAPPTNVPTGGVGAKGKAAGGGGGRYERSCVSMGAGVAVVRRCLALRCWRPFSPRVCNRCTRCCRRCGCLRRCPR
jgi:hypothetical protein